MWVCGQASAAPCWIPLYDKLASMQANDDPWPSGVTPELFGTISKQVWGGFGIHFPAREANLPCISGLIRNQKAQHPCTALTVYAFAGCPGACPDGGTPPRGLPAYAIKLYCQPCCCWGWLPHLAPGREHDSPQGRRLWCRRF